jgi:hypothetical protein
MVLRNPEGEREAASAHLLHQVGKKRSPKFGGFSSLFFFVANLETKLQSKCFSFRGWWRF